MSRPSIVSRPSRDARRDASRPRIAVVGSGLAGLTATWLLGRSAEVTVFERHARAGMGAHSIRLGGTGPLVDVPLRVFTPAYYPRLLRLYDRVGVRVAGVDYAASFSRLSGDTYFRYRNVRVAGRSVPWTAPTALFDGSVRSLARDLVRLHREGPARLRDGSLEGVALGAWLDAEGYGSPFVEGFLLPTYAAVCTCTLESVRRYPADVIVRYFCSGVTTLGVLRAEGGSEDVIQRLLRPAADVHTATPVTRIRPAGDGVEVVDGNGDRALFDHVVLASRADQGARMVEGDARLTDLLARVPHERSRVVVHSDVGLAPVERASWRPINMLVSEDHPAPMATIWLNRVQAGLKHQAPLFQTWNPIRDPDPATVITEANVARPVVTVATRDVPARIAALHDDPARRIWPVGSYAEPGIPLLEAAAASAIRVAERLGAT